MDPHKHIYTLILEPTNNGHSYLHNQNHPISVAIQFCSNQTRKILGCIDTITGQEIDHKDINIAQFEHTLDSAVDLLKWAAHNDPEEINPEIKKFLKTL
ncbi:MAG: hypothetical protein JRD89_02165 [Deltaproteobacteria bacterium]|nr:hypothetical protein [Deltaproteobacteria bacterium]